MESSEYQPIEAIEEKRKVVSEIRTVMVEGKEHKAKVIYVDFRDKGELGETPKHDQVVCHIHGIGNSSQEFNRAADRGDFSGVKTLETLAIDEAKEKKGVYFQAQLLELPIVERKPSFREDAKVHLAFLEQAGVDVSKSDMTINGYSEGAGVAKHLAKLVQERQPVDGFENKLRLFSLTGIVPVEGIHKYFSQHVWNQVIMAEAARRVKEVFPEGDILDKEIKTTRDQMDLIGMILREITIGNRKEKALDQLKEAVKGNLLLLADVGRRFSYDIWHSPRQMTKFLDREKVDLDDRWNIEMRLPRKDGVYPLGSWLESMGLDVDGDGDVDMMDAVAFVKEILVDELFPGVGKVDINVYGGSWFNSENYHTGPTDAPEKYYQSEGDKRVVYVRGEKNVEMPMDVEMALV